MYELAGRYKNSLLLNFAIHKILMQPGREKEVRGAGQHALVRLRPRAPAGHARYAFCCPLAASTPARPRRPRSCRWRPWGPA